MTERSLRGLVTEQRPGWREALNRERLETLWSRYDLPRPIRWRRTAGGVSNPTWLLELDSGETVVWRRYHPRYDLDWIRYEHSILTHLKRHSFPVAGVIPAVNGSTVIEHEGIRYACFEYLRGTVLARRLQRKLHPRAITAAGDTLATYHQLMEGFTSEGRATEWAQNSRFALKALAGYRLSVGSRSHTTRYDRYVLDHVEDAERRLADLDTALHRRLVQCEKTVVHGDFIPDHLLFCGDRVVGVIDFANAHHNVRLADVAYAVMAFAKWFGSRLDLAMAQRFLRAYQARYPLAEEEAVLLPSWMMFTRLQGLWWDLMQYYEYGRRDMVSRFAQNIAFVRWIETHEPALRALAGGA